MFTFGAGSCGQLGHDSMNDGDLPNPGIEPRSSALQVDALTSEPPGKPRGRVNLRLVGEILGSGLIVLKYLLDEKETSQLSFEFMDLKLRRWI